MLRKFKGLFLFYKCAIVPSLLVAIAVTMLGMKFTDGFDFSLTGKAYFFMSLLWLYFKFQVRFPEEYYFYYNLGLGKLELWSFSGMVGLFIGYLISSSVLWL